MPSIVAFLEEAGYEVGDDVFQTSGLAEETPMVPGEEEPVDFDPNILSNKQYRRRVQMH